MALGSLITLGTLLLISGLVGGNLAAQGPGYIVTDFSFEGTFGIDVFDVDGSLSYNLLPNQQAAPPPGFGGGCSLEGTFPPGGNSNLAPLNPSMSGDGSTIVFARSRGFGIWKMNADGSNAQEVVPNIPAAYDNGAPAISPDGTKIAYVFPADFPAHNNLNLFTVNIDGSERANPAHLHPSRSSSERPQRGLEPGLHAARICR